MYKHTSDDYVVLHLSLIEHSGPYVLATLMARKPSDFNFVDLYTLLPSDFVHMFGFTPAKAALLVRGLADRTRLDAEITLIEQYAISWMTKLSAGYPTLLDAIIGPPLVLYWQGAYLKDTDFCMAIIGSRRANHYGHMAVKKIVPDLVAQRWTIVSGGALGADSMAHQATLDNSGRTIAVMGSGLLKPYPRSNQRLFKEIVDNSGTLISSFPLNMDALPGNFPARNRIISGLSRGCVVIQATKRSGARITAHYALDQGRDVFVVPGAIDDPLSEGCHMLIQQGAKLIMNAGDIMQEYGQLAPSKVLPSAMQPMLSGIQGAIVQACRQPQSVDDLLLITDISLAELNNHLFQLQLDGLLIQDVTGMWLASLGGTIFNRMPS